MLEVIPLETHKDSRGSLFELYRCYNITVAMAYCAITNPGCARSIDEWHVHYNKQEYFIIVGGEMELAVKDGDNVCVISLSASDPTMVIVGENTYHSLRTVGDVPATIVVLTDNIYNPDDEHRVPFGTWSWPDNT